MTVAELIELLKAQPPDVEVATEGCDCLGDVGSVDYRPMKPESRSPWGSHRPAHPAYVLIKRTHDE